MTTEAALREALEKAPRAGFDGGRVISKQLYRDLIQALSQPEVEANVERVAKAHAFARRSRHDCARDPDHYWENTSPETQQIELEATRAAIQALSARPPEVEVTDEVFANAVWAALKGDHNDLRKQKIILNAHRAAIQAMSDAKLDQPEVEQWQPIETAPSEGIVLVIGGRHREVACVEADGPWWRANHGLKSSPTHWRPLPAPPIQAMSDAS